MALRLDGAGPRRAEAVNLRIARCVLPDPRLVAGRALWFYPTIGAAVTAGVPWLTFSCPVCGPVRLESTCARSTGTRALRSQT